MYTDSICHISGDSFQTFGHGRFAQIKVTLASIDCWLKLVYNPKNLKSFVFQDNFQFWGGKIMQIMILNMAYDKAKSIIKQAVGLLLWDFQGLSPTLPLPQAPTGEKSLLPHFSTSYHAVAAMLFSLKPMAAFSLSDQQLCHHCHYQEKERVQCSLSHPFFAASSHCCYFLASFLLPAMAA